MGLTLTPWAINNKNMWRPARVPAGHQVGVCRASMLRKGRNSRGQHLVWSETQQETDVMTEVTMPDREEWEQQLVTEISDLESEVDYLAGSQTASDVVALPSTPPLLGENLYSYKPQEELNLAFGLSSEDLCEDEDHILDWVWDEHCKSSGAFLSGDSRKSELSLRLQLWDRCHPRPQGAFEGQHYWEVKMTSPVYGTDMMVGIGTSEVNLDKFKYSFGSLLGHDEDSWGLSYTGLLQHKGDKVKFCPRFGQGSIIGVHLDTWHGTLSFYQNRQFIGVAATNLQNKKFYPMVCSTAAKSSMKVIRACYTPTSLQYLCCSGLRQMLPCCPDVVGALELPPACAPSSKRSFSGSSASPAAPAPQSGRDTGTRTLRRRRRRAASRPAPSRAAPPHRVPAPRPAPAPKPFQKRTYICAPVTRPLRLREAPAAAPDSPQQRLRQLLLEPEDYQCKRCRWT